MIVITGATGQLGQLVIKALLKKVPASGIVAAVRKNTWIDYLSSSFAMIGICVPTFVMGPLAVLAFALHLHWFNASGWYTARDRGLPAGSSVCPDRIVTTIPN